MRLLFENKLFSKPKVSIILLDWSCRESFHFLHYINNQNIPREQYEVIWIEFYNRKSSQIETWINQFENFKLHPPIDKWIVMDIPKEYYFHKHFMYNIGIAYSSGEISVICDSDAIVKPTFVESIIKEFEQDPNIVLHMDELRNYSRKYYPFNYPEFDEIEKEAINLSKGKPFGLVDTQDVLHNRNYGSCFCAKKKDIIAVGGADEHIDYLGHICGPYELTFRLINAGKTEKWHQTEWLYHVWHPGQAGDKNFAGPHDGRMMSSTALAAIDSKRIMPLLENELIKQMRESQIDICNVPISDLSKMLFMDENRKKWIIDFYDTIQTTYQSYDHEITITSFDNLENISNPEISVLLATLRPQIARKCIDSIAESSYGVNYEVVVVSPLDMKKELLGCKGYRKLRFVKDKKEGNPKALSIAYENARGKYIFAIADDHRIGKDCLKNLINFMKPNDDEIFLAGTRSYGAYGPGSESKTYGFYYAFTPCIRREVVEQIGGFYDPYYKSVYGDPDLAMRVWHNGGKVELCPDAWVEYHNELDAVDSEAHSSNAQIDFNSFYERWHPIYGYKVKSSYEKDINTSNDFILPGLPPEKCSRIIVALRHKDWPSLQSELRNNDLPICKDFLVNVFKEAVFFIPLAPEDIIKELFEWLIKQILIQASIEYTNINELFESANLYKINCNTVLSNIFISVIAMFYLTDGLKRELDLVVENYKGINILYGRNKFYAWPCSLGGFSFETFENSSDKFAFSRPKIYEVIKKIDELDEGTQLVDWQQVCDIENLFDFQNESIQKDIFFNKLLQNLPDEICLKILLYLKLKDWDKFEKLLDLKDENVFIIKNHICYVYSEIIENINIIQSDLLIKFAQWLSVQIIMFLYSSNQNDREDDIRLVVFAYREYNFVHCSGLYYGWPWYAEGFSLEKFRSGDFPDSVVGKNLIEVKNLIDEKLGSPPTPEEENEHNWVALQYYEDKIKKVIKK